MWLVVCTLAFEPYLFTLLHCFHLKLPCSFSLYYQRAALRVACFLLHAALLRCGWSRASVPLNVV